MSDQVAARGSSSSSRADEVDHHRTADLVTVLVVEDDPSVAEVLTTALRARGHQVVVARTGESAIRAISASGPGAVLLDLGLPDMDGVDVCRRIRDRSSLPILVVTADGDEDRMVLTLEMGADDYVTKPFSTPELMARLRAALRTRLMAGGAAPASVRRLGGLVIDTDLRIVSLDEEVVHLTQKEFALLASMARRPNSLVTRAAIMDAVWPAGDGTSASLRVHLANLRRKLGSDAGVEIRTEPGIGYRLVTGS